MGKKHKKKLEKENTEQSAGAVKRQKQQTGFSVYWLLLILLITGVVFYPMLDNGFTNWDDEFYVLNNALLPGPDWQGIFSQSVVGNYHPLTIITLALNYAISGLDASSYLQFNLLLHLFNTALVFYFIFLVSGKNLFAAIFTALVFGIHPMHVESVVWISERKDVLYSVFFLPALIQYWHYLQTDKKKHFWLCFLFFLLSLLSKPAAVILPVVLLLLDYWKGRPLKAGLLVEKIPFFLFAFLFGVITLMIQSPTAVAGLEVYPLWARMFFAPYVVMIYFFRFFIPYPLSAFHPFPTADNLGMLVYISPVVMLGLFGLVWYLRKNRAVVFGFLFFVINLLLVLQVISIGLTIVSERYTYIPYIGLAFMVGMLLSNSEKASIKTIQWVVTAAVVIVFGYISHQRTSVWENSGALWSDVIKQYPDAAYARTNRANYLSRLALDPAHKAESDALYKQALEDCNRAISMNSNMAKAYEVRGLMYVDMNMNKEAMSDADNLIRLQPENKIGYDMRGTVFLRQNQPDKAMADYNKCIALNPDDHRSYNNRGTIYHTYYKRYAEALQEYNKAISINPLGYYYLNRSYSYYSLGDMAKARIDVQTAIQKGQSVPDNYLFSLQLK
jgi:protein O-mannosyl-transferase